MDSERLKKIIRLSTLQVKANGYVSPSLSIEMIGYIRELEAQIEHAKEQTVQQADRAATKVKLNDLLEENPDQNFTGWD